MTFLSWRKDYQVGVAQIDAEHRGLFDLINEFHDSGARGDGARQTAIVLNRLIAYAEEHFQHEEQLMRENDYPLLEPHCELHSALVASIFAINERLAADAVGARAEILPFIRSWLVEHIVRSDMQIADFLQRKARQGAAQASAQPETGEAHRPESARELAPS